MGGDGLVRVFRAALHSVIPSLCGMFVYRDVTSAVTNMERGLNGAWELFRDWMWLRKCVEIKH